MKLKTKEIAFVSLFVALITIGSKITIPLPIIPFTLQWMFVALSGILLGAKLGSISMTVYVILGLIGLPVFNKGGGLGYIVSPSFGYLLGFIAAAYIIGKAVESMEGTIRFTGIFVSIVLGLAVVYTLGVSYMYIIFNFYIGKSITLANAIWTGALIFIPSDIFSTVLCSFMAVRIGNQIRAIIDN